jgi:hypothetical protein
MKADFLRGFAHVTGLSLIEADGQWAAHSRQLSDSERNKIESMGFLAGIIEGTGFRNLHGQLANHG